MDQMSVIEHLRFYARVRGVDDIERNVAAVIAAVGLTAFSERMAAKLSGKLFASIKNTGSYSGSKPSYYLEYML